MAENKKAAKEFVDKYFPVKEPKPKATDVFGDLFSPPSKQGPPKKQGYEGQNLNFQRATADGRFYASKSQTTSQRGSGTVAHCEISEPCLMSSSVDYGCRDNYPYNPDNRYPGPSSYRYVQDNNDRKDGSDHANPEIGGAEWWQGSFYY